MIKYHEIGDIVTCVDNENMEMKLNKDQEYIVKSRSVIDGDFVYGVVSKTGYDTWGDDAEEIYCTDRFKPTGCNYTDGCTGFSDNYVIKTQDEAEKLLDILENKAVNHPSHYNYGSIEVIDFIESTLPKEVALGFMLGNALKYISRAYHKDAFIEDMEKAKWYVNRAIKFKENS